MSSSHKAEYRRRKLLSLLQTHGNAVPVGQLATKLGVTNRTIIRDSERLRMDGFRIDGTRGRGGGLTLADAKTVDSTRGKSANQIGGSQRDRRAIRPIFVGRESELTHLDNAFKDVFGGASRVVMIAGEPGIGKSTTVELAASKFRKSDARVLWGRCPESEGAISFWPWAQIVRTIAKTDGSNKLVEFAEQDVAHIGEVIPDVFEWIPDLPRGASLTSPESNRYRLYRAFADLLTRMSGESPLVLIFEDLHWADRSSLQLIEFVAREVAQERILIVGTYRDVEVGRDHPLRKSLAEFNRSSRFSRLTLRGLTRENLSELWLSAMGSIPNDSLIGALHERTEGNPFFVCETVQQLAEEPTGLGRQDSASMLSFRIPEGIREAVGRRLDRLSPQANDLLRIASVLGQQIQLHELLQVVSLLTERGDAVRHADSVVKTIDEAISFGLLDSDVDDPGSFRFTHSLLRDTLYLELGTAERARLHQVVGESLELLYSEISAQHLPRLAHHFVEAAALGDMNKAVDYLAMAGASAAEMVAYEDATSYYQAALKNLGLIGRQDVRKKCQLLVRLGKCQYFAGELLAARQSHAAAAELALSNGIPDLLAEAAIEYEAAGWQPAFEGSSAVKLLRRALDLLGDSDPTQTSRVLAALARALAHSGENTAALDVARRAIASARQIDDPLTLAHSIWCRLSVRASLADIEERMESAREAIQICKKMGEEDLAVQAQTWLINDACDLGDAVTLDRELRSWWASSLMVKNVVYLYAGATVRVWVATRDGRLEDAERLANDAYSIGKNLKGLDAGGVLGSQMFWVRREQGRLSELKQAVELFLKSGAPVWRPGLALICAELGMYDRAKHELELLSANEFSGLPRDSTFSSALAYLTEVCDLLGEASHAATLYRLLEPMQGFHVNLGVATAYFGPADRFLGILAGLKGSWNDGELHFKQALERADSMRSPSQVARTQFDWARMLSRQQSSGDLSRARSMLESSIAACRELGLHNLLSRASVLLDEVATTQRNTRARPGGLTTRELEVLRLMAAGRANREIAGLLYITPNTVAHHVKNILYKVNATNRTEAATIAAKLGVV